MIRLQYIVFFVIISFIFLGCEDEKRVVDTKGLVESINDPLMQQDLTFRTHVSSKEIEENGKKKIEEITFSTNIVSAIDFLNHKGKKIDPADLEDLKKETVVILEFESEQEHKSILTVKRNSLNKDKTMEYLMGGIANEISIFQDGKTLSPNGHQYENSFGKQNKARVYFFFSEVDKNKELRITYHDKLFGAGLINFSMNKNFDI